MIIMSKFAAIATFLVLALSVSCILAATVSQDAKLYTHQNSVTYSFCIVHEALAGSLPNEPAGPITVTNNAAGFTNNYFTFDLTGYSAVTKATFKTRILDTSGGIFTWEDSDAPSSSSSCTNVPALGEYVSQVRAPAHGFGGSHDYTLDVTLLVQDYIRRGKTSLTLVLTSTDGVTVTTGIYRTLEITGTVPASVTVAPATITGTCTAAVVLNKRMGAGSVWTNNGEDFQLYDITVTNTGSADIKSLTTKLSGANIFNLWGIDVETGALFLSPEGWQSAQEYNAGFIMSSTAGSTAETPVITITSVVC